MFIKRTRNVDFADKRNMFELRLFGPRSNRCSFVCLCSWPTKTFLQILWGSKSTRIRPHSTWFVPLCACVCFVPFVPPAAASVQIRLALREVAELFASSEREEGRPASNFPHVPVSSRPVLVFLFEFSVGVQQWMAFFFCFCCSVCVFLFVFVLFVYRHKKSWWINSTISAQWI